MKMSAKEACCTALTRNAVYARVNLHKKTGTSVSKSHRDRTNEKTDQTELSVKKQLRSRKEIVNKRTTAVKMTVATKIKVLSAQDLANLQGGLAGKQVGAVEKEFPSRDV